MAAGVAAVVAAGVAVGPELRVSLGVGGKMMPIDPAGVGVGGGGDTTEVGCGVAAGVAAGVGVGGAGAAAGATVGRYAQGCSLEGATMPAGQQSTLAVAGRVVLAPQPCNPPEDHTSIIYSYLYASVDIAVHWGNKRMHV